MSATFTYILWGTVLVAIILAALFTYFKRTKITDVKINPVIAILSSIFFMALWLFDLTSLQMGDKGLWTYNGVIPGEASGVPSIVTWIVMFLAMGIITVLFYKYNQRFNKKSKEFHKWLIITQMIGLVILLITALTFIIKGGDYKFLGFYIKGIYHAMLPLIIIPNLILLIDTR